ncbi:MAG: hypothetical protein ABSG49_11095 [Methanoregula sp.]|jgi:hypothetical protein|uniref:hypothetical protein n=1 Tax=Methanoregula sp. TaxID=2052170 RepID=UPI003C1460FE
MKRRSRLLRIFDQQSPYKIQQEDDDGTFFPREISEPEIVFVPLAEPHVIITDLYENPKDWYYIREIILDFAEQAYTAYYRGLYFASFMCSVNCLELTLKYEFVRRNKEEHSRFEGRKFNFNEIIRKSNDLGLKKYIPSLHCINNARDGLFHFNPKKLNISISQIRKDLMKNEVTDAIIGIACGNDSIDIEDLDGDLSYYLDNLQWSNMAYYAYSVMFDITKELYGEKMKLKFIKEGLADYEDRKMSK